ncbi:uncharacterized protein PHALS_01615 [Plasmopara halstedii]|uniref:Uncharacterized protein n=1 Tax=Plasmopara halstedii TaxID=4781 RepID=A0A0P1AVF3_PLAHL|nr:uncharacterized protein PHALS_01615 [Plasmopara halstedii]CEG45309.1 hypothetical protein PHALS_01615 [Plasmopara halstedii]|eukprot:XP_024581678.1 hypothetical protein PHALS_01615 [Plasmopara halstedii]
MKTLKDPEKSKPMDLAAHLAYHKREDAGLSKDFKEPEMRQSDFEVEVHEQDVANGYDHKKFEIAKLSGVTKKYDTTKKNQQRGEAFEQQRE